MDANEEELLYLWYQKHGHFEPRTENSHWMEILENQVIQESFTSKANLLPNQEICNSSVESNSKTRSFKSINKIFCLTRNESTLQNLTFNKSFGLLNTSATRLNSTESSMKLNDQNNLVRKFLSSNLLNETVEVAHQLGVDVSDADVKWNSAMQTPSSSSRLVTPVKEKDSSLISKNKMVSRSLFLKSPLLKSEKQNADVNILQENTAEDVTNQGDFNCVPLKSSEGFDVDEKTTISKCSTTENFKCEDESKFIQDIIAKNCKSSRTSTPIIRNRKFTCKENLHCLVSDMKIDLGNQIEPSKSPIVKDSEVKLCLNKNRILESNKTGSSFSKLSLKKKTKKFIYPDTEKEEELYRSFGKETIGLCDSLNDRSVDVDYSLAKCKSIRIPNSNESSHTNASPNLSGSLNRQKYFVAARSVPLLEMNRAKRSPLIDKTETFLSPQPNSLSGSIGNKYVANDNLMPSGCKICRKDCQDKCKNDKKISEMNNNFVMKKDKIISGFQSASGNPLQMSKESIDKAKRLCDEMQNDSEDEMYCGNTNNVEVKCQTICRPVREIDKSLKSNITCNLLQGYPQNSGIQGSRKDFDAEGRGCQSALGNSSSNIDFKSHVFSSNYGNISDVSERALGKDRAENTKTTLENLKPPKLKNLSENKRNLKENESPFDILFGKSRSDSMKNDSHFMMKNVDFKGFSSASGKRIDVSVDSLQKAKNILEDVDDATSVTNSTALIDSANHSAFGVSINSSSCIPAQRLIKGNKMGFSSASGKQMVINPKSLEKAKELFSNVDDSTTLPNISVDFGTKTTFVKGNGPRQICDPEVVSAGASGQSALKNDEEMSDPLNKSTSPVFGSQKFRRKRVRSSNIQNSPSKATKYLRRINNESIKIDETGPTNITTSSMKSDISSKIYNQENVEKQMTNYGIVLSKTLNNKSWKAYGGVGGELLGSQETLEIDDVTEALLLDSLCEDYFSDLDEKKDSPRENRKRPSQCNAEFETWRRREMTRLLEVVKEKMKPEYSFGKHTEGELFLLKRNNDRRIPLRSLSLKKKMCIENAPANIVTSQNAKRFRFQVSKTSFERTVSFSNGVELVPGSDDKIGWEEIEVGLKASRDVDPRLIPVGWVANHFRWVVWKLAAYHTRMECIFKEGSLTVDEVVRQLRYRYDVELLGARRPFLRKVYEGDDVPKKSMVLCVADINLESPSNSSSSILTLTDGWYSIDARFDSAMQRLIKNKRVRVGQKLIIHGAELVGSPESRHPLQHPDNLQLLARTNMTRPIFWHARLGVHSKAGLPPSTLLSRVYEDGGPVASLDLVVTRRYPLVYLCKSSSGNALLNERAALFTQRSMEKERDALARKIQAEVEKEIEQDQQRIAREKLSRVRSAMSDQSKLKQLSNGQEIFLLVQHETDPSLLQSLTRDQLDLATRWRADQFESSRRRISAEVNKRMGRQHNRLIPMIKLAVVDKTGKTAEIKIWSKAEELFSELMEGRSFKFHYLCPTGTREDHLQLSWSKNSHFRRLKREIRYDDPRKCTSIDSLSSSEGFRPWGEIDTVGVVAEIHEPLRGSQTVLVRDPRSNSFVALRFSPSVQHFRYSDVMVVGQAVSIMNARVSRQTENGKFVLLVTPHTRISNSAGQRHLQSPFKELSCRVKTRP